MGKTNKITKTSWYWTTAALSAAVAISLSACQQAQVSTPAAATDTPKAPAPVAIVPAPQPAAPAAPRPVAVAPQAVPAQPVIPPAQALSENVSIPAGQRVFYCSHSLMWDTPAPLGDDVKAFGIQGHELVGLERIGFSTTKQHWDQPAAQNQSKKALDTGKVDDFIMSPMELPDEGITNFVKYGLEKNPKMRFFAQNNWAAFNIDAQKWHSDGMAAGGGMDKWDKTTAEQIPTLNATSLKLYEAQVDKINKDVGHTVIWIIPTDQANEALRIKVAKNDFPGVDKQSQLFRDTIGHPGPVLQALNAYVHFATIYGRSPIGLPLPTVLKNEKARNPKIDDDFNKRLQEIAWDAVTHYSYSGVKAPEAAK